MRSVCLVIRRFEATSPLILHRPRTAADWSSDNAISSPLIEIEAHIPQPDRLAHRKSLPRSLSRTSRLKVANEGETARRLSQRDERRPWSGPHVPDPRGSSRTLDGPCDRSLVAEAIDCGRGIAASKRSSVREAARRLLPRYRSSFVLGDLGAGAVKCVWGHGLTCSQTLSCWTWTRRPESPPDSSPLQSRPGRLLQALSASAQLRGTACWCR